MATAHEIEALARDPEVKPLLFERKRNGDEEIEVQRVYLKPGQRAEKQREIAEIRAQLDDPLIRKRIQNPGALIARNKAQQRDLDTQSPPPLTPGLRDKLARLDRLLVDRISDGMPTGEQMRRKPPGAVDQHTAWDRANKRHVLMWKAGRRLLHPDSDAVDLCNVEQLRRPGLTNNLHVDAQLPGVFALTEAAKANYDAIDWHDPAFQAELRAKIESGELKVNYGVRRGALRKPSPQNDRFYECKSCEWKTSGGFGAVRLKKHEATHLTVGATA